MVGELLEMWVAEIVDHLRSGALGAEGAEDLVAQRRYDEAADALREQLLVLQTAQTLIRVIAFDERARRFRRDPSGRSRSALRPGRRGPRDGRG